ncbi:hypothetical protein [Streptomyces sp. NPDC002088]|uniref:hypothetical protein n=1 Tax=Streptomyces sp. NPDC002088 TaxID=3154665 RepID=UPI0033200763
MPKVDGLAHVCAHLDELRSILDDTAPLDRVLDAIHNGGDPAGPMQELHQAVQAAGDALGVLGHTTRAIADTPGLPAAPLELVYLCPSGICTRYSWSEAHCEIHDAAMRRERLP